VARLSPVDLVIVEGYKAETHAKLEVHRKDVGKPLLYPNDPNIVAIASDLGALNVPLRNASIDDVDAIADIVEELARPYP
jgi:molybdopterin-guanine dinucleotide biosynthesis protein B